jgi:hypothetical protein
VIARFFSFSSFVVNSGAQNPKLGAFVCYESNYVPKVPLYSQYNFLMPCGFVVQINRMVRGLALLPALCLFISVLALHVGARLVPDMFDCGPLQKHRYRCDPPLTRTTQAASGQLTPTDIHDRSSIQEGDQLHLAPTKIDSSAADGQTEITNSSTSRAAHDHVEDGVAVVPTLPPSQTPTSEGLNGDGPQCGPLEKHRYRCTPPLTRIRDINAVG